MKYENSSRKLKAIQTSYKGYKFRSRLEARWAVLFDAMGIAWEYEIEGFLVGEAPRVWKSQEPIAGEINLPDISCDLPRDCVYLPDFWLPGLQYWVEVKGPDPTPTEIEKFRRLCAGSGYSGYMVYGGDPCGDSLYCKGDLWVGRWADKLIVRLAVFTNNGCGNVEALCALWDKGESAFKSARFGKGGRG